MLLEDYLDFQDTDDIRVRGHRIGIEIIISEYLEGLTAEQIQSQHPTLSLEEVYACLTYYWRNRAEMDAYVARWRQHGIEAWERQQREEPPPVVKRLRELARERGLSVTDLKGPSS